MSQTTQNYPVSFAPLVADIVTPIDALRRAITDEAIRVATEFHTHRLELSEGFSNLNVVVRERSEGKSVQIGWALFHFRNGKRTGISALKKHRGASGYDLATIKLNSPDWLKAWACETELRLRPLREALDRLTSMERDAKVIAGRIAAPTFEEGLQGDDEDNQQPLGHDFVEMSQ